MMEDTWLSIVARYLGFISGVIVGVLILRAIL